MTSTTAETLIRRPAGHPTRRSIVSFMAGLALASAVSVGLNVAANDSSSEPAKPVVSTPSVQSHDVGCQVMHGPC